MAAYARGFKTTNWSRVLRARGEATEDVRKALEELYRAYHAPLLAFARRLEADPDRAEDLVQGFFARLVHDRRLFDAADPKRGRFRTFLRAALRHHAINAHDAATAQKRGGGAQFIDADLDAFVSPDPAADALYDRLWARALLDRALARLAEEQARSGKEALFSALRGRLPNSDDDTRPLAAAAAALRMSVGAVKVALLRLRRRFAELVREEVAETVERPEDVDAELRELREAWRDDP